MSLGSFSVSRQPLMLQTPSILIIDSRLNHLYTGDGLNKSLHRKKLIPQDYIFVAGSQKAQRCLG